MFKRLWIFIPLLLLCIAQPVSAHGYIVRAIPEDRAALERPPTRLQYWFSEALEPDFSGINVRDQNGDIIATGGVTADDNTLMSVRLPNDLPEGAYVVELRPAFASDGHVVAESRVFFVGEEVGGVAGSAATSAAVPLEVVWRALVLSATMLLFGTCVVYANVLVPAWGSRTYPAGGLPPRVMKRLNVILGYALLVAFLGNGLALIQQTMTFFNIGFVQALDQNFWSLVRIGSRFGDIWNARLFFLGLVGVMYLLSLNMAKEQPALVRAFWTANVWVMALVIGSFSVLSHAAGSLVLPWVGITVDWLHALAVGFWAGGVAALALVLPVALKPYQGEERRLALLAVLRRFSRIAVASVAIVITTGIYSASNWFYSADDVTTPFGGALAIKVALVALLLAVGALHHMALRPARYARFESIIRRVGGFVPTLRVEAALVLLVLAGVGLLSATPVPVPAFAEREVQAPTATQSLGDLDVTVTLLPGGPGVNTFDTLVTRNGAPVDGLTVNVRNIQPTQDTRGDWHPAEAVEDGLYVTASADIDDPGQWWTVVSIDPAHTTLTAATDSTDGLAGTPSQLAFAWDISADAAVIDSVPPNAMQILALAVVIITLGWACLPLIQRLGAVLNLDTFSVGVATAATAATVVAMVIGFVVVQNTRENYAATLNPPPQVVNAVLPDQASVERGAALFTEACAWSGSDFEALVDRLPRTRDEELYLAVGAGWRGLAACTASLDEAARWDVVNYVRALEQR
ncbi:MAG: hypothetical protein OHK0046_19620 [Anaerolineae bacterium]